MKMYLVLNKKPSDYCVGGLFTNKEASIKRAWFLSKGSNPKEDHWQVLEVSRQDLRSGVPSNTVIYDTRVR